MVKMVKVALIILGLESKLQISGIVRVFCGSRKSARKSIPFGKRTGAGKNEFGRSGKW